MTATISTPPTTTRVLVYELSESRLLLLPDPWMVGCRRGGWWWATESCVRMLTVMSNGNHKNRPWTAVTAFPLASPPLVGACWGRLVDRTDSLASRASSSIILVNHPHHHSQSSILPVFSSLDGVEALRAGDVSIVSPF